MSNLVGATTAVFPVRLSVASNEIVNVEWTTSDGTALSGLDYKAAKGVVKFLPGETEKQIQALVYGQPIVPAADKVFYIRLSPPSNAILVDSLLTCKIVVDDLVDPPATSIIVAEGRRGPKGETGRSAYEQAVYMGLFTGTVEQWMQQIADASSAADRAENAAVAANIGSKVYATPQAGVNINTGVPAGDYFNVRSLSSNHYVDEYQNVAGVATATGKSYPNIGWVERNAAIAEAAAISATISSGIYQTPSAGVAPVTGVPVGDYFNVRSVNSEHYVDEYQNVAGVATATGKSYPSSLAVDLTKQQILDVSDRVGNTWRNKVGGYGLNDRVMLENGDIVKSTVANNTNNPNVNMTGWDADNKASKIIDAQLIPNTQTKNSFKNAYSSKRVNQFKVLRDQCAVGRAYIWKNPTYTSGAIIASPFTSSDSHITGTCTSGYTVKLAFSNGSYKTAKAVGTVWSIPNTPPLSSADLISLISYDADYRFSLGVNMNGYKTAEWDFVADVDDFYRMRYGFTNSIRPPTLSAQTVELSATPFGTTSNNQYFRSNDQIGANFKINFTGIGFLMNHRCDEYGGLWSISVDGAAAIIISTNISNPENSAVAGGNISKVVTSTLSNTAHTAVFTFIGDDPNYPPTGGVSRGWFKKKTGTGVEVDAAYVITGAEMGRAPTSATLVANAILEFAISAKPSGSALVADWIPAHGSASGCIMVNSRKIFINENQVDNLLSNVSSEAELKEFTMIQIYTAYNSADTLKSQPLWTGKLITKFDRLEGLVYDHSFVTNNIFVTDGYTAMCSGQRKDSSGNTIFTKIQHDNGFTIDISAAPPLSQINHDTGVLASCRWVGDKTGLAIKVDSVESSSALGRATTDGNATLTTERPDRFCKLYFKPLGKNKEIEAGEEFTSRHSLWLATF